MPSVSLTARVAVPIASIASANGDPDGVDAGSNVRSTARAHRNAQLHAAGAAPARPPASAPAARARTPTAQAAPRSQDSTNDQQPVRPRRPRRSVESKALSKAVPFTDTKPLHTGRAVGRAHSCWRTITHPPPQTQADCGGHDAHPLAAKVTDYRPLHHDAVVVANLARWHVTTSMTLNTPVVTIERVAQHS